MLRSQHTPHPHPAFTNGASSHDQEVPSHEPPTCPDVEKCRVETDGAQTSAQPEVSEEVGLSGGTEGSKCSLDDVASESTKSKFSPSDAPSPRTRKSLSSLSETPSPRTKKSRTLPDRLSKQFTTTESSSPESENTPAPQADSLPSSPAQDKKEKKSSKRKGKKDGGSASPKRKRERKRGLSTSSSEEPKSSRSRSRTESGGSDVLEALDLSPMNDRGSYPTGVCMADVQGSESLDVQSPDLNVSERTLIAEQDNVAGFDERSKSDSGRVFFDLQSLTSPTDTSSPIIAKEKKAKKKKKSQKDGESGHKSKRSSKRKRGLSTSSSEDPKSSRSRTESVGSETTGSTTSGKGQSEEIEDLEGISLVPCGSAVKPDHLVIECGSYDQAPPIAGPDGMECQICITDYDEDYSEC